MAEIENVVIFRADTGAAVKTVGDLKASISFLKKELDKAEVGTKAYADTLVQLQTQQAALKNAMHDTTYTTEEEADAFAQTAKQAKGLGTSYNALVRQMADLDQQFRNTEDVAKRDALGAQIKNINAQLKEMDAQRGKFGRNVGNYSSALDNLGNILGRTGGQFGKVVSGAKAAKLGFDALSTTPVIGVLGLLASALSKVISGMKTSEENTMAWERALAAFKPIADAFTRSMQQVGKAVADVANWIVDLLDKWGLLNEASQQRIALEEKNQRIIQLQRATAINNAQLEQEVAELRNKAAQKEKYTAKERLAFLEQAVKWEEKIAKNNKELAEQRLAAAEEEAALTDNGTEDKERLTQLKVAAIQAEKDFYVTTRRLQSEMATARREIANEGAAGARAVVEQVEEETGIVIQSIDELMKILEAAEKADDERRAAKVAADKEVTELSEAMLAGQTEALQAELDAQLEAEYDAMMEEREIQRQRIDTFTAYCSGISTLASSLADIYEADSDASEAAAKQAKDLQTASAIISTIGGAVSAYMNTINSIPNPVVAIPLAIINAASVLAAGYAQVKKIQQTKVGKSSGSSVSTPSAVVSAPAATAGGVQEIRTITGASEEDRLNRMASDTRVYVVESDITNAQNAQRVRVAEASF